MHGNSLGFLYILYTLGKRPLLVKRPCTKFQGVSVAASTQIYAIYILGKCPCRPKSLVMFKHPWALTWDTMVHAD